MREEARKERMQVETWKVKEKGPKQYSRLEPSHPVQKNNNDGLARGVAE